MGNLPLNAHMFPLCYNVALEEHVVETNLECFKVLPLWSNKNYKYIYCKALYYLNLEIRQQLFLMLELISQHTKLDPTQLLLLISYMSKMQVPHVSVVVSLGNGQ